MNHTTKIPRAPSVGEETFAFHCKLKGLFPVREYLFHPERKWRIDFAWPHLKFAVEVESSVHRIRQRFAGDLDKYNALNLEGWTLLRYTRQMIESGQAINEILPALEKLLKEKNL
jgi:very-short-patch-repair endonuclease